MWANLRQEGKGSKAGDAQQGQRCYFVSDNWNVFGDFINPEEEDEFDYVDGIILGPMEEACFGVGGANGAQEMSTSGKSTVRAQEMSTSGKSTVRRANTASARKMVRVSDEVDEKSRFNAKVPLQDDEESVNLVVIEEIRNVSNRD